MRCSYRARSLSSGTRPFSILAASVAILLVAPGAVAQAPQVDSAATAQIRSELHALSLEMASAVARGDRMALERVYAPEYIYIHATGYQNDRAGHITEQLDSDSASRANFAALVQRRSEPPGELYVHGDVAIQRFAGTTPSGRPLRAVTIYAREDGRWRYLQAQSTVLQPERTPVPVATGLLDAYAGDYGERPDGGPELSIRRQGAELIVRGVPVNFSRVLTPVGDARFFDKLGFEFTFVRGADGQVSQVETHHEAGMLRRYRRRP